MNGDYIAALDIRLCLRYAVIKAAQPRPLPPEKYFALFALRIWVYTKFGIDPFAKLPAIPEKEPEFVDTLPLVGANKIPRTEGHGYELPNRLTISGTSGWLNGFLKALANSNNF